MTRTVTSNLSKHLFVFWRAPLLALLAAATGLVSVPASAQNRVSSGSACVSKLVSAPIVAPNVRDPYIDAYRAQGKIRPEDSLVRGGLVYTCPLLRTSIAKKVSNIVVRHSLGTSDGTQRITCSLIKQATSGQGFSVVTTLESTVNSSGTDMVFADTVTGGSRISVSLECDLGSYSEILSYRWKEG